MADDIDSKRSETWLQRLGFDKHNKDITLDQLLQLLSKIREKGLLGDDAVKMIQTIVKSAELTVRDIMIPRARMVTIEIDASFDETLERIITSGHSRFPVLSNDHEEIIGMLLSKDLLPYVGKQNVSITELIRPVDYVPEGKYVTALMNEFRTKRSHLALVVDEFGSVSGLITIEDLLEQIVGNINDEHDFLVEEEPMIRTLGDSLFIISALVSLEEFNLAFNTDFQGEDVETMGGLLMKESGLLPQAGEEIKIDNILFKILPYEGNFINKVEVLINKSSTKEV